MQRFAGRVFWFVVLLLSIPMVVTAAPLNVVYIIVDDLGAHDLACYGNTLHQTPHIDRLAQESMKFTQAYAASPVCSPTRASLMTGKNPARLKMTVWHEQAKSHRKTKRPLIEGKSLPNLTHDETTIAERLHQAGYRTLHVGKWHLGEAGFYPESHGFEVNIGGTLWGAPQTFFYPFAGDRHYGHEFRYVPGVLERSDQDDYLTDRLTDEAIRLLKSSAEGARPFYLNMAFHTVHTPIEGKPDVVKAYEKKIQPDSPWQNAEYAAMVASLDENVGRILKTLEELKLDDRTAVLLMSDNGGFINQYEGKTVTSNHPLRSGKGSLYEGGIRIPLLVRWPGVTTADSVCGEPVVTSDLYPTLIDLLELGADQEQRDGVSLKPLLTGSTQKLKRDRLHFHYPHYYPTTTPASAMRAGNWKLIHYYEDDRNELYDLSRDPSETTDLSAQKPEQAQQLWNQLHAWLKGVDASFPQVNPERRK